MPEGEEGIPLCTQPGPTVGVPSSSGTCPQTHSVVAVATIADLAALQARQTETEVQLAEARAFLQDRFPSSPLASFVKPDRVLQGAQHIRGLGASLVPGTALTIQYLDRESDSWVDLPPLRDLWAQRTARGPLTPTTRPPTRAVFDGASLALRGSVRSSRTGSLAVRRRSRRIAT